MNTQNYKNHRQIVYSYYLLTGVPIIVLLIIAIKKLIQENTNQDLWVAVLLIGWILLTLLFRSRGFALKAQDRAIRAEESLRHYILTGELLPAQLTLSQIIALRFAADNEFTQLAQKSAAENLSNKTIKQEIKTWRADTHRV